VSCEPEHPIDHDGETIHDPLAREPSHRIARAPARPRATRDFKSGSVTQPSDLKQPISVVLIEDNRLFRMGLSSLIRSRET
jgi:hypothetical protein